MVLCRVGWKSGEVYDALSLAMALVGKNSAGTATEKSRMECEEDGEKESQS